MSASDNDVEFDNGQVLVGDCRQRLADLEPNSVDSVVTDPPYGISFMGKDWDDQGGPAAFQEWNRLWLEQVMRVLKPGGHALVFGATRMWHRMVCAAEDAGFEVRDQIAAWTYGTGFPKSHNVSKAIDKAAGAERPVVGKAKWSQPAKSGHHAGMTAKGQTSEERYTPDVTGHATEAAKRWDGWGTALKPAWEPIAVLRKPLPGTVAENVQRWGTGAINIDATRIGSEERTTSWSGTTNYKISNAREGETTATGRWPANQILVHHPECQPAGTRTVKSNSHHPASRGQGGTSTSGHKGQDGLEQRIVNQETVDAFDCHPDCHVRQMDHQSGISTSGAAGSKGSSGFADGYDGTYDVPYGDTGGASRFFYVAKPSKRERNLGCHHLPTTTGGEATGRKDGSAGLDSPRAGAGRTGGNRNTHPTVKPIELLRYLVRMVTPPGGQVLDPFLGSGTTAMAAELEGFRWLGCELTDEYVPIIVGRISWAQREANSEPHPPPPPPPDAPEPEPTLLDLLAEDEEEAA